mmetsp:Transcript_123783/g.283818  ORF Transcript_123783/g.283818 Transcript_123783/m.283818 type:complete len:213 (-) Transcript_123783:1647-2285(-)
MSGRVTSDGKAQWKDLSTVITFGSSAATTVPAGFRACSKADTPNPTEAGCWLNPPAAATVGSLGILQDLRLAEKHQTSCLVVFKGRRSPKAASANFSGLASWSASGDQWASNGFMRFCRRRSWRPKSWAAVDAATSASQSVCWLSLRLGSSSCAFCTIASSTGRTAFGADLQTPITLYRARFRRSCVPCSTILKKCWNTVTVMPPSPCETWH